MSMPYSKLPAELWKKIGINAGVLLSDFDLENRAVRREDIIGATTGPVTFNARPSFEDLGADVNNCPRNSRELLLLRTWDVKLSGTFVAMDTPATHRLIGLAVAAEDRVTPRSWVDVAEDFADLWMVVDYGDVHEGSAPGAYVIHMKNTLSTGGFQFQAEEGKKALWPFEFTAHNAMADGDEAPFEVYVLEGVAEG